MTRVQLFWGIETPTGLFDSSEDTEEEAQIIEELELKGLLVFGRRTETFEHSHYQLMEGGAWISSNRLSYGRF